MATTFLEPGGDAIDLVATTNGFWKGQAGGTIVSDIVHGNHIFSHKYLGSANQSSITSTTSAILADAGSRVSLYVYIVALPTASVRSISFYTSGAAPVASIVITSAGVLQMANNAGTQIGTNGPTLSTGVWYRISIAYTITSTSINRFEVFIDGVSAISITNATLTNTGTFALRVGYSTDTTAEIRVSDIYVDNSSSLTDTGDIWVTAKRPIANGTTNGFTTQIGAGGSGYGTGHSPQVNERPLSTTNGWSMVGAGSAVTEEYNIESQTNGDMDFTGVTLVDYVGWASMKSLVGETVQMIVNGTNFAQAITSTATLYTKVAGSTTYPAGTGADIGITTDTSLTTVSLYECGIICAFSGPPILTQSVSVQQPIRQGVKIIG